MTCQVVYKYEINIDRTELILVSAWDFVWSLGCSLAAATYNDRLVSAQYYIIYKRPTGSHTKNVNITIAKS